MRALIKLDCVTAGRLAWESAEIGVGGSGSSIFKSDDVTQHFVRDMMITLNHVTIERKVRDLLKRIDESVRRLLSIDLRSVPDKDLWVQNKSWRPQLSDELQIIFTLAGSGRRARGRP